MSNWDEDDKLRRDLHKAREYRDKPRYSQPVSKMAKDWLRGPEAHRIKKFHKVNSVIQELFDEGIVENMRAHSIVKGSLTVHVTDSVLMSELKNHHHHRLLEALIHAGTGITSITYRIRR